MEVSSLRLVKNPESSRKAFASVVVSGIVLNDIAIVEGQNGLFLSMPQRKYKDESGNDKYTNIYNPITKEARDELVAAVMAAYEKALEDADSAEA